MTVAVFPLSFKKVLHLYENIVIHKNYENAVLSPRLVVKVEVKQQ